MSKKITLEGELDHYCANDSLGKKKSPCEIVNCGHGKCTHEKSDFICECEPGWTLDKNKLCTQDVNECKTKSDLCDQNCINTEGKGRNYWIASQKPLRLYFI